MDEEMEAFKENENYTCKVTEPQNDRIRTRKQIFRLFVCVRILHFDKTFLVIN